MVSKGMMHIDLITVLPTTASGYGSGDITHTPGHVHDVQVDSCWLAVKVNLETATLSIFLVFQLRQIYHSSELPRG